MTNNILDRKKSARSDKEEFDERSEGDTSSDSGEIDIFFVIKTICTNLTILFIIFYPL